MYSGSSSSGSGKPCCNKNHTTLYNCSDKGKYATKCDKNKLEIDAQIEENLDSPEYEPFLMLYKIKPGFIIHENTYDDVRKYKWRNSAGHITFAIY